MAYSCLKVGQDRENCTQRAIDGHCFYCPLYQDDSPYIEPSEETKAKVLESFIEAADVALRK